MPELPEVEILVRHLRPLLCGREVRTVEIRRAKVLGSTVPQALTRRLRGMSFVDVRRRGKYLLFELRRKQRGEKARVVGHLGMTGRMYLLAQSQPLPKHAAVVLNLGRTNFVFEDTRYFGKFTLDSSAVEKLGPEPLEPGFTAEVLRKALRRSSQPVKVKLLDQATLAGLGNIYASEALFRARVSPFLAARRLSGAQVRRLWRAIRNTLTEAIRFGSTVPLNYGLPQDTESLFYFGRPAGAPDFYEEQLQVYDRAGRFCYRCGVSIKRVVQAGRSTFYCPACQQKS